MQLNKIYSEDCMDTMSRMPDGFVDLTVGSPPYDCLRSYKNNIDKTWGEHVWKPIIKELYRVTKQGGVVVWVVSDATINGSETGTSFKQTLWAKDCGFNLHDTMIYERISPYPPNVRYWQEFEYMFIWSKGKPKTFNPLTQPKKPETNARLKHGFYSCQRSKNGKLTELDSNGHKRLLEASKTKKRIKSNIWKYSVGGSGNTGDKYVKLLPACFPENLAEDHILSWSNKGDLVYDPFMGGGTTAKMAILNDRNYIGSEIAKEYCEIAEKWISDTIIPQKLF